MQCASHSLLLSFHFLPLSSFLTHGSPLALQPPEAALVKRQIGACFGFIITVLHKNPRVSSFLHLRSYWKPLPPCPRPHARTAAGLGCLRCALCLVYRDHPVSLSMPSHPLFLLFLCALKGGHVSRAQPGTWREVPAEARRPPRPSSPGSPAQRLRSRRSVNNDLIRGPTGPLTPLCTREDPVHRVYTSYSLASV